MRVSLAGLATLATLATLAARPADACTCADPPLGDAMSRAEVAFVGKVTSTTKTVTNPDHCKRFPKECEYHVVYHLAVEGVWKGDVAATVDADPGMGKGDCSHGAFYGKVDRLLILTSVPKDATYRVRLCSGSRIATDAVVATMTKAYGTPRKP